MDSSPAVSLHRFKASLVRTRSQWLVVIPLETVTINPENCQVAVWSSLCFEFRQLSQQCVAEVSKRCPRRPGTKMKTDEPAECGVYLLAASDWSSPARQSARVPVRRKQSVSPPPPPPASCRLLPFFHSATGWARLRVTDGMGSEEVCVCVCVWGCGKC